MPSDRSGPTRPASWRLLGSLAAGLGAVFFGTVVEVGARELAAAAQARTERQVPATPPERLIGRYCLSCHNERLQTAGLSLETVDWGQLGPHAEVLERVRMKLRAGAMPPAGRPRPDATTLAAFLDWLETGLDRAAAEAPNPGRTAAFHRLNRNEYRNAIRDILRLEVDTADLLPADDAAFGFDNIGDMLTVSPVLLERYLSAANTVSRLAIGDTSPALGSAFYPVSQLQLQDDRMSEDLPFGSRGGVAFSHYFPADGEYVFTLQFGGAPSVPANLRIDGALAAIVPHPGGNPLGDPQGRFSEVRLAVAAGSHLVGISFPQTRLKAESRYPRFFPWGNSATFGTNTGSLFSLKLQAVDIGGPFNAGGLGDTESRRHIFGCRPEHTAEEVACASQILSRLARQAFRRPILPPDIEPLLDVFRVATSDRDFDGSMQMAVERLLVDPEFLFRIERDPEGVSPGESYRVHDLALASRLSFFLWSSVPDEELLEAAEQETLGDPAVLAQHVRRMLAEPKAKALVRNFASQWLYLRNIEQAAPDSHEFPDWDDDVRAAFRTETELFLEDQIRSDRPVTELLSAPYTFVNERLAEHYGITNVYGSHFRRVELPDTLHRGGLLGHGSILLVTSFPNRTSPVVRGKWLMENFLNIEPPQPPPDVPEFPDATPGEQPRSVRERLEEHRKNPVCASCHNLIDPLGFALEHFDAIGRYRATGKGGQPIDASAAMPDGTTFHGLSGLRDVMLTRETDFVQTVVDRLLTYALGRGLEHYDQPVIRKIIREAEADGYRWSSLILGITKSMPFRMKRAYAGD